MCSGLRDAANLAWKLQLVLAGFASDGLLDTYESERLPSAKAAIEFSMELGKVICVPDPAEASARDEAMAAAVGDEPAAAPGLPAIASGCVHSTSPHAGLQLVQGKEAGQLFDEVHGTGWRLVLLGLVAADIDAAARGWFESIGGRVVSLRDPDALFTEWFNDHGTAAALQRPDFYIYGTASTAECASSLLVDLRHQLQGGSIS